MTMASVPPGGCEMDEDGDGSQGTAEPNLPPLQRSSSPELSIQGNQKQIKTRQYPSKEVLPQKV